MRTADTRYVDARMRYPTLLPPPSLPVLPFPSVLCLFSFPQRRQKDLRTIMHCALWSDPDLSPSLPNPQPNPRGAGVLFGPDSTRSFLDENGLDMVVRSHECVEEGFDLPFEDDEEGKPAGLQRSLLFLHNLFIFFFFSVDRFFVFAAFCFVSWMDCMVWGVAVSLCLVWLACGGGSFEGGFGLRFEYVCTRWRVSQPEAMLP